MKARLGTEVRTSLSEIVEVVLQTDALDDERSAHRERVGIRRFRARLATFRPVLRRGVVDDLDRRVRGLGTSLGAIRDLDVLAARLADHAALLGVDAELWAVQVAAEREVARRQLAVARADPSHLRLRRDLVELATAPPFRRTADLSIPPEAFLVERVVFESRRFVRSRDRLGVDPTEEQLHEFRKRIKRTRFVFETAAVRLGDELAAVTDQLAELATRLGELQDAATARAWLLGHPCPPGAGDACAETHRALVEHEAAVAVAARESSAVQLAVTSRAIDATTRP